jgi:LysR substrate binding domain
VGVPDPRRPQAVGRGIRWPNNLGLVVLDTLILRLMFPLAGVGMAFLAQGNNWGLFNLIPLPVWVAIPAAVLPACRRHATNRTGRAQRTSSHTTQETPPALPHGCAVYLVSEVDKPGLLHRLMHECYRGGLKSPRVVQEGLNEATILSLVSTGLGVGWVLGSARWRCPQTVAILPVVDFNIPVPLALAWRRDNSSPLIERFVDTVRRLREVRAVSKG